LLLFGFEQCSFYPAFDLVTHLNANNFATAAFRLAFSAPLANRPEAKNHLPKQQTYLLSHTHTIGQTENHTDTKALEKIMD